MTFASNTSVSVEKSRAELDRVLAKAGASQRMMGSDDAEGVAYVVFTLDKRQVRLRVPMPRADEKRFQRDGRGRPLDASKRAAAYEQGCRTRWRQLLLLVKAKLEAITLGLSTVEREFLADLYLADGRTVHQAIEDGLADMYMTGAMPPLLGPTGSTGR